jgi:hypothetical protein
LGQCGERAGGAVAGSSAGEGGDDRFELRPHRASCKTVTRRIRDAIARTERAHPPLGRHLHASIRTGVFCSYAPERDVHWTVEPTDEHPSHRQRAPAAVAGSDQRWLHFLADEQVPQAVVIDDLTQADPAPTTSTGNGQSDGSRAARNTPRVSNRPRQRRPGDLYRNGCSVRSTRSLAGDRCADLGGVHHRHDVVSLRRSVRTVVGRIGSTRRPRVSGGRRGAGRGSARRRRWRPPGR